jgi:predicted nucleic acid-binding Zn ribbon protein
MKHKAIDTKARFNKPMCLMDEIDTFMSHIGLDARMHELKILEVWKESVGESIASYSTPVELRKNKLFVSAENAAWRYELSLRKQEIMDNLNEHLKKKLIKEIIFV